VHRVREPNEGHPFAYLETVAEDRLGELDPSAVPPKPAKMTGFGPGGGGLDTSDPKIQEILRKLQKQELDRQGGAPSPVPLPGPNP